MSAGDSLTVAETAAIDRALADAARASGLVFNAHIGPLGADPRATATELHAATAEPTRTVLVAVDLGQHVLEIVTGHQAGHGLTDGDCQLAALTMISSFRDGEFTSGMVAGIQQLGELGRSLPILHARDAKDISA